MVGWWYQHPAPGLWRARSRRRGPCFTFCTGTLAVGKPPGARCGRGTPGSLPIYPALSLLRFLAAQPPSTIPPRRRAGAVPGAGRRGQIPIIYFRSVGGIRCPMALGSLTAPTMATTMLTGMPVMASPRGCTSCRVAAPCSSLIPSASARRWVAITQEGPS